MPAVSLNGTIALSDGLACFSHVSRGSEGPEVLVRFIISNFLLGAFTIMNDIYDTDTQTWNLSGVHLVRQQDFWYVMGMTLL